MICPLMSLQTKNFGEYADLKECRKEKCAWWVEIETKDQREAIISVEHKCAIVAIAERKA